MKKILFYSMIAATWLCSCSSDDGENGDGGKTCTMIELTESEKQVAAGSNDFAVTLFKSANELADDDENLVISPLSASLAMSMAVNGAAGSTLDELTSKLGYSGYLLETVNGYNNKLVKGLAGLDNTSTISVANAMWLDDGFTAKDDFETVVSDNYETYITNGALESSASTINKWCSEKTKGVIANLLDNGDLDESSKFVILNALYFKGSWTYPFNARNTKEDVFYNADGTEGKAKYMCAEAFLGYGTGEGFSWIDRPFGNTVYRIRIILPDEGTTIDQCLDRMVGFEWSAAASSSYVNLMLPKFSFSVNYDLKPALENLGIVEAFADNANFANLSSEGVKIAKVKQANSFSIDEQGVTAAGSTSVVGGVTDIYIDPDQTVNFHVQRPFIFMLTEQATGSVLFMGRVSYMK